MTNGRIYGVKAATVLAICCLTTWQACAQSQRSSSVQGSENIYEDLEIRLPIPRAWKAAAESKIAQVPQIEPGILVLEKNAYRLKLAYHTDHASGIIGGRFIEAFDFGWPGLDDPWNCSLYLKVHPQPASRNLIFLNLVLDSGVQKVRENCGIVHSLGFWKKKSGTKEFVAERRWVGGYFAPVEGEYFWGGSSDHCGFKSYTLTPTKRSPDQFPDAGNPILGSVPRLEKTIQEAIDIVNSIHYKRCAPF